MFKGITPVISIILLLLITISMVGFVFVFFGGVMTTTTEAGTGATEHIITGLTTQFKIEGVDKNKVYIRNIGPATIDSGDLRFYVGGVPVSSSGPSLDKGEFGTFTLDDTELAQLPDTSEIKVTGPAGISVTEAPEGGLYEKYTVGHWKFDEGSGRDGATVSDSSGNGNVGTLTNFIVGDFNDGTLNGGAGFTNGRYGYGLGLDGIGDYVTVPTDPSIEMDNDFTVEFWMKASPTTDYWNPVSKGHDGTRGWAFQGDITTGDMCFLVPGSGTVCTSSGDLRDDTWHHIAATKSSVLGEGMKIYLDGDVDGTNFPTLAVNLNTDFDLSIGTDTLNAVRYFNGIIDEVRIYDSVLSEGDIERSMVSAYPINTTVASYSFENNAEDTHNWIKGVDGTALSFDGSDDFVDVGAAATDGLSDQLTVEAWVYFDRTIQDLSVFGSTDSGNNRRISLRSNAFTVATTGVLAEQNAQGAIPANGWVHYVGTYDGSDIKVYWDGVFKGSQPASFVLNSPVDNLIGSFSTVGWYMDGTIDELKILNIARSMETVP